MSRWRDLAIFAAAALVVAIALPQWLGGADLDRAAVALTLAGPAAGAALTLAVGRPNLAIGAFAGAGAYISGALAIRGIDLPLAVLLAVAACAAAGALLALLTSRLDVVGLLAATLLVAVGLLALTQALPQQSGGQAGLGPLPALGTALPGGSSLRLTSSGDLHAALAFMLVATALSAVLLAGQRGARWRAVGSDRARAASSGLTPLRAEVTVMAIGSALAAAGGAMAAHLAAVATPDLFAPDVVALPLLAALLAGRGNALGAVGAAVTTGVVGGLVLPDLGWRGTPSAAGLALAFLAVAVVASLLPGERRPGQPQEAVSLPEGPWPFADEGFDGAALTVAGLDVRAGPLMLVRDVTMSVAAAEVHGLVGPNGAGKSSLLAAIAAASAPAVRLDRAGVVVVQPQAGGGFAACTVDETLVLAAGAAGRDPGNARRLAVEWRSRLGLDAHGGTLCADLSGGRRRLVELARVVLRRPAVLLCDEPLAGLDPAARAAVVSLLGAASAAGLTIVLAEHDRAAVDALATSTTELRSGEVSLSRADVVR